MAQTKAWVLSLDAEHRAAIGNQYMVEYVIASELEIMPIPLAPDYSPGVIVWREQIVPVIDIARMLTPGDVEISGMTGVMILAYQEALGESLKHGAVVLRAPPRNVTVSKDMACPLPENPAAWRSLALACFTEQDQAIPILNAKQVFSAALREIYRTSQAAIEVDAAAAKTPAWEQTTAGEAMSDEPLIPEVAELSVAEGPPPAAASVGNEFSMPQELMKAATDSFEVASETGEPEAEPSAMAAPASPKSQEHPESETGTPPSAAEQPSVETGEETRLDETETVGPLSSESPDPDVWQQPVQDDPSTMEAESVDKERPDAVRTGVDLSEPDLPDILDDDIQTAASLESAPEQFERSEIGAETPAMENGASPATGEPDLSTTWGKPLDPASGSPDDDSRAETSVSSELLAADADEAVAPRVRKMWVLPQRRRKRHLGWRTKRGLK